MGLLDGFPSASGLASANDIRLGLAGLILRDTAGNPRTGIFPRHTNALVTSTAAMASSVAAFEGAFSRAGQGVIFLPNDGPTNVAHVAAPVSNSRYDIIYAKQFDNVAPNADATNVPAFGVFAGPASAGPTPYTYATAKAALAAASGIGAGAEPLAMALVPSTATTMQSVGVTYTQLTQFTCTTGGTYLVRALADLAPDTGYLVGQQARALDTGNTFGWNGAAWVPVISGSGVVFPSAATNGSVSSAGGVTSTAQPLVRVRDAFPAGATRFRILFDITVVSAAALLCVLSAGATDAVTLYDNQLRSASNTTNGAAPALAQPFWTISGISIAGGRHVGEILLWAPNAAIATQYLSRVWSTANPGTTGSGLYDVGGQHQAATAYDSITFKAASGNIVVNSLSVEAIGRV